MAARRLERYDILEEVGQGGMAKVFRGYDTTLGREVAVKILHPHLADQPESKARLQREAQAVAKLRHENILEIFDYSGPDSNESYIVTEYIHGTTLKHFFDEHGVVFPEIAVMIIVEVCAALVHAHASGIIHRDIKPENVMIRTDGRIKLTDFGIAQVIDKDRMTVTGQLLGSPSYMAPEHVEGKVIDFRTDVFSVGILLYQLATGELPFRGKNPHEVLKRIAEGRYLDARLVKPAVGERLGRILARTLERAPDARYADVAPLLEDLRAYLDEIDFASYREELAAFFADPKGYRASFEPRLIEALMRAVTRAAAEHRRAAALELLSRVLTLRPDHAPARQMLARLSRHSRLGVVVGVVALAGAAAATFFALQRVQPVAIVKGPAALPPPPSTSSSPSASPVRDSNPQAPPAKAHESHKSPPAPVHVARAHPATGDRPPPPASGARRHIRLETFPKAVRVFIDGKPYDFSDANPVLDIPVSAKHLHVENDACYPQDREITQADRYPISLQWLPAKVQIRNDPDGAILLYKGRPILNHYFEPEIHGPSRTATVKIEASAAGYRGRTVDCTATANEKTVCEITLEKAD